MHKTSKKGCERTSTTPSSRILHYGVSGILCHSRTLRQVYQKKLPVAPSCRDCSFSIQSELSGWVSCVNTSTCTTADCQYQPYYNTKRQINQPMPISISNSTSLTKPVKHMPISTSSQYQRQLNINSQTNQIHANINTNIKPFFFIF